MNETVEKLKALRQELQLTKLEISLGCDVTESTVARWLKNSNTPHPQHLEVIENFIKETRMKMVTEAKNSLENCMSLILDRIYDDKEYDFVPTPKPGEKVVLVNYPRGLLWRSISLQDCAEVTEKRTSDPILVKSLELLARAGRIKVFRITIHKKMNNDDCLLFVFIGEGEREPFQPPKAVRLYKDKPLHGAELEAKDCILDIEEQVNSMRKDKSKFFDSIHGTKDLELETALFREEIEDESELRTAQLRSGEKGEKMKGKKQELKVELEEVKFHNDGRIPQVFYDANGVKVIIEPGQTKMFLKRKRPRVN